MSGDPGRAWRAGEDLRSVARRVSQEHDRFLRTGRAGDGVRPLVAQSWQRSLRAGLDPETSLAPLALDDAELDRRRRLHPLAAVLPVIRRLLVEDAAEAGLVVGVSDAAGRLLWVEGDAALRRRAESMHFVAGADWSEEVAGTNAPGTALALGRPVQIFAAEHLARPVTPWSCSAAPIHDPDTGAVLGALDLTGGDEVAAPHSLSLVRATVAAAEGELRLQRLLAQQAPAEPEDASTRFEALGRGTVQARLGGTSTRLTPRHSEIAVVLAARPDGTTGDQLAVALSDDDLASGTLRAEMSRLRGVLGDDVLASRPYRLGGDVRADWLDVVDLARRGAVGPAVDLYRGPVLPTSEAPGVRAVREHVERVLREALLRSADPDALLRYADTDHARLDWEVWHAAWSALPSSSSRRTQVAEHLRVIEHEVGARGATSVQRRPT